MDRPKAGKTPAIEMIGEIRYTTVVIDYFSVLGLLFHQLKRNFARCSRKLQTGGLKHCGFCLPEMARAPWGQKRQSKMTK
jgi:hypothetical protein